MVSENQDQAADNEPVLEESDVALPDLPPVTSTFLFGGTYIGEGLRAAWTRLRVGGAKPRIRSIAVVSSNEGDGKTSVALGLAAAAANAGQKTVLIDADLRRRQADVLLGIEPLPGLAEWLEHGQRVLPLRRLAPAGFYLLSAGKAPCRPELLSSPRMTRLLKVVEGSFDLAVLDCAPLLPVADSLALRDQVSGFILVVRARHSPREGVARVASLLGKRRILGTLMNAYDSRLSMRKGHQYGYGSSYRYGPRYRDIRHS